MKGTTSNEILKSYPYKFKLILTLANYVIFFNIGISALLPVVTMIDLAYLYDSSVEILSYGLTAHSVFAFFASLLSKF